MAHGESVHGATIAVAVLSDRGNDEVGLDAQGITFWRVADYGWIDEEQIQKRLRETAY